MLEDVLIRLDKALDYFEVNHFHNAIKSQMTAEAYRPWSVLISFYAGQAYDLSRNVLYELRKPDIFSLNLLYSRDKWLPIHSLEDCKGKRNFPQRLAHYDGILRKSVEMCNGARYIGILSDIDTELMKCYARDEKGLSLPRKFGKLANELKIAAALQFQVASRVLDKSPKDNKVIKR
jgi:hypothetical protein